MMNNCKKLQEGLWFGIEFENERSSDDKGSMEVIIFFQLTIYSSCLH